MYTSSGRLQTSILVMQIDIKEIVNVEGSAFVSTTGFTYIVVVFLLIFYLALVPTASFVD